VQWGSKGAVHEIAKKRCHDQWQGERAERRQHEYRESFNWCANTCDQAENHNTDNSMSHCHLPQAEVDRFRLSSHVLLFRVVT
jgi:hypothetical protein